MDSKKKIILIIAGGILLLAVSLVLIFMPKEKTTPPKKQTTQTTVTKSKNESFADSFVKEFTTYNYKNPSDYKNRLNPYLAPNFVNDFNDRFGLPSNPTPDEVSNYSMYKSTIELFTMSNKDGKQTIYVEYTANKVDAPSRPKEFTETNAVMLQIQLVDNKPQIISVDFATTD